MNKILLPMIVLQLLGGAAAGALVLKNARAPAAAVAPQAQHADEPAQTPPTAHAEAPRRDAKDVLDELIEGNARFVSGAMKKHDVVAERDELVGAQHPKAIVLSCSDSRVPPELIFDQSLGDLFVVRNAGNVADPIVLASIEYAAEHLGPSLIIVLGHEKCGAVTAAASGSQMPTANLQALVGEILPGLAPLRGKFEGPKLVHEGVEANVRATADALVERSALLKRLVEEKKLRIVDAVYELDTGMARRITQHGQEAAIAGTTAH